MGVTRQMFDHMMDITKGWMPGNKVVDCRGQVSALVTLSPLYQGRCVHFNSSGQFQTGATGTFPGVLLLQNSDDPDVSRDSDTVHGIQGIGGGYMSGILTTGDFEVEDSEYDTTKNYTQGDYLRGIAADGVLATGGLITNASFTLGTNAGIGIVSRPAYTNHHKTKVLPFWTRFSPGTVGN